MEKLKIVTLFVLIAATSSSYAQSINNGLVFSVSPGVQLNGVSFGHKIKKYIPYVSFQMMNINSEFTRQGTRYDFNAGKIVSYNEKYTVKLNMSLPTIGLRYYFIEKEKLQAYGNINFSKVLFNGKVDDSTDPSINSQFQSAIENVKIYTGQVGVGAEYFMDKQFSVGGEFGVRYLRFKDHSSKNVTVTDPNTGQTVGAINSTATSVNVTPTYSKVSLNFYFGK